MNQPHHVAVILDGNRRFAKRLMAEPWKGHEWGYEKVKKLMDWCKECNIPELTLYAFSLQNFHRPKNEFEYLMRLAERMCDEVLAQEKTTNDPRVSFIGRTHLLNPALQEKMRNVETTTEQNAGMQVNICFAYGGREEITDAVKAIAEKIRAGTLSPDDVGEELIKQHLQLPREPDLIIRTGGERRTSNFLMWQSSYAELYFTDALWPEFEKEQFLAALEDFEQRKRRFGQ
ncbi:MAG: polyprenyl diphosphate synthase [archaeon]